MAILKYLRSKFRGFSTVLGTVTTDEKRKRERSLSALLNLSGQETSLLSLYCPALRLVILLRVADTSFSYRLVHAFLFMETLTIERRLVRVCYPLTEGLSFVEEDRRCPGTCYSYFFVVAFRTKRDVLGDTHVCKFNSFN